MPTKGRRGHQNLRATEGPTGGEGNPRASVFQRRLPAPAAFAVAAIFVVLLLVLLFVRGS